MLCTILSFLLSYTVLRKVSGSRIGRSTVKFDCMLAGRWPGRVSLRYPRDTHDVRRSRGAQKSSSCEFLECLGKEEKHVSGKFSHEVRWYQARNPHDHACLFFVRQSWSPPTLYSAALHLPKALSQASGKTPWAFRSKTLKLPKPQKLQTHRRVSGRRGVRGLRRNSRRPEMADRVVSEGSKGIGCRVQGLRACRLRV